MSNRYGEHLCEVCNRQIPEKDIEHYSIEAHGVDWAKTEENFRQTGDDREVPLRVEVPCCCADCADWEACLHHEGEPPPWRVEGTP